MSIEVRQPPSDWITSITYSPSITKNLLATTSWDKKLRIYDTDLNTCVVAAESQKPLLDCTFCGDETKVLVGGLDDQVSIYDIHKNTFLPVGKHVAPVRSVRYSASTRMIFSGGWDKSIQVWDYRTNSPITRLYMEGACHGMDISSKYLTAIDSFKKVYILDLAKSLDYCECRDKVLKYQMRCIRCFPDNQGFAVCSIEGRVAWEYFDRSPEAQAKKFSFKCHRTKDTDGIEVAYPVNALAFHPQYGTFVTGGSDGGVSVWDGQHRRRLWRLPPFKASVAGACFNVTGNQLAIATSSDTEAASTHPPQIIIRPIREDDVKPKAKGEN